MAYTRTTWSNDAPPAIDATHLNNLEAGVVAALAGQFNVKDYGAVADGSTNDSVAIQLAIDAAAAATRGVVMFPPGIYVVNSGLTVSPGSMIILQGSGKGGVSGVGTRLRRTSGTTPVLSVTGTGQATNQRPVCEIRDLEISGNDTAGDLLAVSRANHFGIRDVRVASNAGGTGVHLTEVWDSTIDGLWVENCGSGTSKPALLMDSVVGAGADANCATIQISNITFQSNYGTDWRLTGSSADGSPSNDIQAVNVKMEGKGSGTLGTPDTYPYIDIDYAQNCHFANVRISQPTGRGSTFIQQTGTSPGPRANQFVNVVLDIAGSNTPSRYIDQSVGGLVFTGLSMPSTQPTTEYIRLQSSVSAGRFRVQGLNHNSADVSSGYITDSRTTQEELARSTRILIPIVTTDGSVTSIGDNRVYALADAADQYVYGQVILPRDVNNNGKAYLRVYWTASTTGNAQLSWAQAALSAGGNLSTSGSQVDSVIASPGANLLAVNSWSGSAGISATAGQLVTVKFGRKGTHVNDTISGTVYIVALELYYDKRI